MSSDAKKWVRGQFARLGPTDFAVTSPITPLYNCIAWAMGEADRWWWPAEGYYWPEGVPREETVEAFVAAFAVKGFVPCKDGKPEVGLEKAALYTDKGGKPTHAAFLLADGRWASKLGRAYDIEHKTAHGIGGGTYGEPTHFFSRPLPKEGRPDTSVPPTPGAKKIVAAYNKRRQAKN